MVDNRIQYGFRWSQAANGGRPCPSGIECFIDTGEAFSVNGGTSNVNLGPGDLVRRKASGGMEQADGTEGAGGAEPAYGVVIATRHYWDGTKMVIQPTIPSNIAYGTKLTRQTKIIVVPAEAGRWEVDCDDTSIGATEAAYQAAVGLNVDHILDDFSVNGIPRLGVRLDASTAATLNTLHWRIVGISPTENNQDFSGNYVKLWVEANIAQSPRDSKTGV